MRYRRLDENDDMTFGHGQQDFLLDSPDAVAQAVKTRLRLWVGEWFLDTTAGTPWAGAALGMGTRQTIEPAIRARILETQGVTAIERMSVTVEPDTRAATIYAEIATAYGKTTVEGIFNAR